MQILVQKGKFAPVGPIVKILHDFAVQLRRVGSKHLLHRHSLLESGTYPACRPSSETRLDLSLLTKDVHKQDKAMKSGFETRVRVRSSTVQKMSNDEDARGRCLPHCRWKT